MQAVSDALGGHGIAMGGHCLENFVDPSVLRGWMMEGAYVVNPGWLSAWPEQIEKWGFDATTAQAFFGESMRSILLVDTGVDPAAPARLVEFGEFVGLATRRVDVGLAHFGQVLRARLLEWKLRQERNLREEFTSRASRERSTFAMAFAQLGQLAGVARERDVVARVFDLFEMLCGAQRLVWTPFVDGRPGKAVVRPSEDGLGLPISPNDPGSVTLEVARDAELLGTLQLAGLSHPERREEYTNLALALSGVIALAVSNARSWEALSAAREQLEGQADAYRVIANSADGLVVVDRDHRVRFANPAARRLLDVREGQLLEQDLSRGPFERILGHGRKRVIDSRRVHMHWQGEPVVLASLRDVSEQRAAEEAVRRSQKMTLLGQLAGSVAHDFNNVLQAVAGTLELAQQAPEPGEARRRIDEAISAADRGTVIARRLLLFSKPGGEPRATLDVTAEVRRMAPLLRQLVGDHVDLVVTSDDGAQWVSAVEGQIEAIVLNLVTNARDATRHRGRIEVAVRGESDRGTDGGAGMRLSVADDGEGIPPHRMDQIFEPFFTTRSADKGTGLGLPTVRAAVEQMGGDLSVSSQVGVGTRFTVWLPAVASPTPAHLEPAAATDAGALPATVLVVDDEATIRDVLTTALVRAGHQVRSAANAEEAIALLREREVGLDLLLTDITMPGRDGFELASEARSIRPGLPVMFMSGLADVGMPGLAGEDVHLLAKPFRLAQAVERVEQVLGAR